MGACFALETVRSHVWHHVWEHLSQPTGRTWPSPKPSDTPTMHVSAVVEDLRAPRWAKPRESHTQVIWEEMNVKCRVGSPRGGPVTSDQSHLPVLTGVWFTLVSVVISFFFIESYFRWGLRWSGNCFGLVQLPFVAFLPMANISFRSAVSWKKKKILIFPYCCVRASLQQSNIFIFAI